MTNTYSPFDKTIFRHGFRFSAVYYPDTSTIGWTETLTGTLEAFSTITVEHMKVPVTSSNTQKASTQEGTLTLWCYILQEHQFLDRHQLVSWFD